MSRVVIKLKFLMNCQSKLRNQINPCILQMNIDFSHLLMIFISSSFIFTLLIENNTVKILYFVLKKITFFKFSKKTIFLELVYHLIYYIGINLIKIFSINQKDIKIYYGKKI